MFQYECHMGTFYLKDGDNILWAGEEVAIAYDANPNTPCLHKHGDPEKVEEWFKSSRQLFLSRGFSDIANDLTFLVSKRWKVEDLNTIINNSGSVLRVVERILKENQEIPEVTITENNICFKEPLSETVKIPITGWRLRNGETDPEQAKEVNCEIHLFSRKNLSEEGTYRDILWVQGAVTGHEEYYLEPFFLRSCGQPFLNVCAGGMGWDSFRITQDQLRLGVERWLQLRKLAVTVAVSAEDAWDTETVDVAQQGAGELKVILVENPGN